MCVSRATMTRFRSLRADRFLLECSRHCRSEPFSTVLFIPHRSWAGSHGSCGPQALVVHLVLVREFSSSTNGASCVTVFSDRSRLPSSSQPRPQHPWALLAFKPPGCLDFFRSYVESLLRCVRRLPVFKMRFCRSLHEDRSGKLSAWSSFQARSRHLVRSGFPLVLRWLVEPPLVHSRGGPCHRRPRFDVACSVLGPHRVRWLPNFNDG